MNTEQQLYISESAAWQTIRFKITDNVWSRTGLCAEIDKLFRDGNISDTIKERMRTRLERHKPLGFDGRIYWWPSGHAEPRIKMCKHLEEESKVEEMRMAQEGSATETSRFTTIRVNDSNTPQADDIIYRRVYNIQGTQDFIEVVFNMTKGYVTIDDNKLTTMQLADLIKQLSNALQQMSLENIARPEIVGDHF